VTIWAFHCLFFSLLLVATFTDFDYREIPLAITIPGTVLGVLWGALAPWPWPMRLEGVPWNALEYGGVGISAANVYELPTSLQMWPVWMPPPAWLMPGTWQMGLATALAGAFVGAMSIRIIRWVFSWAFDKEAMGLGDADLFMMIGAFLGWQPLALVLVFAVFLALLYVILVYVIMNRQGELPFGPFLAGGALLTILDVNGVSLDVLLSGTVKGSFLRIAQNIFFDLELLIWLGLAGAVLTLFMSMSIRMLRLISLVPPAVKS
jgi:leader peptidase (prepilin peptidase)/N-methyltransferase